MATPFAHSLRALEADSGHRTLVGCLIATLLLGGWLAWGLLARIAVYVVTPTARLEAAGAVHPVAAPVAGQVVATYLAVGRLVQVGEVLVELDTTAQRLQSEEAHVRLAALTTQLQARRDEVRAEDEARQAEQQGARLALEEARARHHEATVTARAAAEEAAVYTRLQARGLAPQLDLMRAQARVDESQAAAETLRRTLGRLEGEQRTRERDRLARLQQLKREVVRLQGDISTATATLARLEHEGEQRRLRAPIAGRLGTVADLRVGAVVQAGETLGSIVPVGTFRVVAHFLPAVALGRLRVGQPARLRLAGFPWTQYGSLDATVSSVADDARDGQVRVELRLADTPASAIPLQHGLPGTLEVAVEWATPATLLLRLVGQHLGVSPLAVQAGALSGRAP